MCVAEGAPVFAERRLVSLMDETWVTLTRPRLAFGDRLAVDLERPARWLDFLEQPGVVPWAPQADPVRPRERG